MAEGRDLVKEAIKDAESLKEAAVESARQQVVESLAPAVRKLLDEQLKGALGETRSVRKINGHVMSGEQRAQNRNPANPDKTDEAVEVTPEALDLESALQEFFPGEGVKENTDMDKKSSKKSQKEAVDPTVAEKKSSKKSEVTEEIEISEAELRKVYEAALQTEVNVKKGFSDIVGGGELDDAHKETGILDKGGEKHFDAQTPPAKKDWTVKEMLQRGLAENKQLRENLRKAVTMIETLGKKLHEVNLFNAKVLHVNKVLNAGVKLTKEQKTYVMESIDKARSISEVKMVFETIVGGFKTQQALAESRNPRVPKADAQRARTTGTPKQDVLSESVDRANHADPYARTRQLAGIVNGKK